MYEEMMMNTDNLESSLQLLFIENQVEFCYKLYMSSCSSYLYEVCCTSEAQVMSVWNIYPYIALLSTIVYTEVQWNVHLESQEQGWQAESVNAS